MLFLFLFFKPSLSSCKQPVLLLFLPSSLPSIPRRFCFVTSRYDTKPWRSTPYDSYHSSSLHRSKNSIDSLLSPRECSAWIRFGEDRGFERSFHKQTSEVAHRDNGRITLHSPEVAAALFARVGPFVPTEMGARYVLRYRYWSRFARFYWFVQCMS